MAILIASLGSDDPCPLSLVDGFSKSGPVLRAVRDKSFQQAILLVAPEYLHEVSIMEGMIKADSPGIEVVTVSLSLKGTFNYEQALESLKAAVEPWYTHEDVIFLPNTSHPVWHVAGVLLCVGGFLKAQLLDSYIQSLKPITPAFHADRLKTFSVASPTENFLDDVATACGLEGQHPLFREALETTASLAAHDTPVLILGETGTGKDVFARFCHAMSPRSRAPFIPVNCAALPESLAESILFGHVRGAFTGAVHAQKGKFHVAHTGTLFLDELAELSLGVQAKLLRVIEDGLVESLGAHKHEAVNVRIVAATNRNLYEEMKAGRFREDLYYRLRVGELTLPPLRSRKTDIILLALYFMQKINKSLHESKRLHPSCITLLENYPWPGNIRDLQNVLERAVILSSHSVLKPEDLKLDHISAIRELPTLPDLGGDFSLEQYMMTMRKAIIDKALYESNNNQSEAARLLGISPQAVNRFVRERELIVDDQKTIS